MRRRLSGSKRFEENWRGDVQDAHTVANEFVPSGGKETRGLEQRAPQIEHIHEQRKPAVFRHHPFLAFPEVKRPSRPAVTEGVARRIRVFFEHLRGGIAVVSLDHRPHGVE